jgi:signal transduction histidine kinase
VSNGGRIGVRWPLARWRVHVREPEMTAEPTKVLMIEDDLEYARAVRRNLQLDQVVQYEWTHAPNLRAGLENLTSRPCDVVLLDLGLPDSDGFETLSRTYERANGVPIIVLTAMYEEEMAVKALELGATEYFHKPNADASSLRRAIRYALERARHQRILRRSEERLRSLSRRLVEAQEAERRSIARELHDEIGQALTALDVKLELAGRAEDPRPTLAECQTLLSELMARTRSLSTGLRPAGLDDLGLLPALLHHIRRYTDQTGVRVDFAHTGLEARRAPAEVETAAFRVTQEALTNVARHAGVNEAAVRITHDQSGLWLEIRDQGRGFDVDTAMADGTSSGLPGMQERAMLVGGRLTIASTPGAGTCVSAEVPLEDPGAERKP